MDPRPTGAPSLSQCEPLTALTVAASDSRWVYTGAGRALESLSWVDEDFSHMQESVTSQGWEKLPWEEPQGATSIVWPKELQDSLEEGREVHIQAQRRSREAAESAAASCLPTESVCILLLLLLQPQCTPAPRAGTAPDWGSYYKTLLRTQRERDGGFKVR